MFILCLRKLEALERFGDLPNSANFCELPKIHSNPYSFSQLACPVQTLVPALDLHREYISSHYLSGCTVDLNYPPPPDPAHLQLN